MKGISNLAAYSTEYREKKEKRNERQNLFKLVVLHRRILTVCLDDVSCASPDNALKTNCPWDQVCISLVTTEERP